MESLNILRNYFNSKPVPEGCKSLAEERDYINYLIDAVEQEHLMIVQEQNKNEVEWMTRLPADSEKKPIHIGDVMKWDDGTIFEVVGIGDGVVFYIEDDNSHWTKSDNKTHCSIGDK